MHEAIMMVDDEAIILLSLRQELRSELGPGYRYEIAMDAEEAFTVFDELEADGIEVVLLISDWLMPGMKGDEFLSVVRAQHPSVRTVMVSGQTDEDSVALLRENGTLDAFIRKPWTTARLVAECRRLLGEDGFAP